MVGFQREWSEKHIAGIRTFALLTVFGTLTGLFSNEFDGWFISAGLIAVTSLILLSNVVKYSNVEGDARMGLTTEIAALVMYAVGVAIALDRMVLAVIVSGGTAVLLQWKKPLHWFVDQIGESDIRAITQLVLIALVILPILPDKNYGPYDVLNPYEIWFMVVLIVGISLGGYITYKFLGTKAGTVISGILGGIISSTATTVSYASRTKKAPQISSLAAVVIMIASTIVFGRVFVEIAVVAPEILNNIAPPLTAMMILMGMVSVGLYHYSQKETDETLLEENPSGLKAAIIFGLLYAGVLLLVAFVREQYGSEMLYAVAALSGLTDMDAITLSTAQMIKKERLDIDTGWRMILIASLSNLFFKGVAVAVLGHSRLLKRILIAFGISMVGGLLILFYWP